MSGSQLLHRVRAWFGGGREEAPKRPAVPEDVSQAVLFAATSRESPVPRAAPQPAEHAAPTLLPLHAPAESRPAEVPRARGEGQLASALDALPERIAQSVAAAAPSGQALAEIAAELRSHHETSREIAQAVDRLPDLAGTQVDLQRHANQLAERLARLSESVVDELAALRSAFRSVEETSRRNVQCFMQIESTHREVLAEYQEELLKQHRRLYRMTLLALVLAAAALGGVIYTLNATLHP